MVRGRGDCVGAAPGPTLSIACVLMTGGRTKMSSNNFLPVVVLLSLANYFGKGLLRPA